MSEPLEAVENRISVLRQKLASRKGKVPYRDNVPLLEKELKRLEDVRALILDALEPEKTSGPE